MEVMVQRRSRFSPCTLHTSSSEVAIIFSLYSPKIHAIVGLFGLADVTAEIYEHNVGCRTSTNNHIDRRPPLQVTNQKLRNPVQLHAHDYQQPRDASLHTLIPTKLIQQWQWYRRDWPRQSLRLSRHAQRYDRSDEAESDRRSPKITRSHPGRAQAAPSPRPTTWLYASHNYAGSRFVDLKEITPANAKNMRPVCLYRSEQPASVQTSPLVYGGAMYLTFGRATVAIDAKTCRERWTYIWQPKGQEISPANRGAAIKDGKLVRGTADGYLISLDMADGSFLWSQPIASAAGGQYLSMPPLIFEDLIIVGPSGADFGAKNWIGAFKLETGEPVWKFNLVPDPGELGAETWENPELLKHGGGSLWTPLSLDVKAGIVYLPVGNPAPDFYGEIRPGANLYTNSLVALDVKTGKLLWYKQFIPHDVHDADLSQVSPLFETTVGGKKRKVISVSGKDGLLRLLDRESHEQFYEVPITTRENVDALPTVEGVHRCPGLLGGMEWNGPAYDPGSNSLFVPAVDWCGVFSKAPKDPPVMQGMHYYGGAVASDPREKSKGWLTAFDASTGKERWKYGSPTPLVASVTATSGGVLFTGDLNNDFLVLDTKTGDVLYRFNTGGSIGGGVVSYALDGKQYVAATSGTVSAFFGGSGLPAVVVFAAGVALRRWR